MQGMPGQVRARPRLGRRPGQGVAALSPRRVAELAASARTTPDSGLQLWTHRHARQRSLRLPLRVETPARGSYGGRKFGPEASPLRPWEPIGARSLGARALTRSVLRPLPPARPHPSSAGSAHPKGPWQESSLALPLVVSGRAAYLNDLCCSVHKTLDRMWP